MKEARGKVIVLPSTVSITTHESNPAALIACPLLSPNLFALNNYMRLAKPTVFNFQSQQFGFCLPAGGEGLAGLGRLIQVWRLDPVISG